MNPTHCIASQIIKELFIMQGPFKFKQNIFGDCEGDLINCHTVVTLRHSQKSVFAIPVNGIAIIIPPRQQIISKMMGTMIPPNSSGVFNLMNFSCLEGVMPNDW